MPILCSFLSCFSSAAILLLKSCNDVSVTQEVLITLLRHWPQSTNTELIMVNENLAQHEQNLKRLESSLRDICEATLRAEQFSKHAWTLAMETFGLAEDVRQTRLPLEQKGCVSSRL